MTDRIDAPGLYALPMADYQADPCPEPSLSSHVAHLLVSHSPHHAWLAHPRLNPDFQPEQTVAFDLGTAVHACVLGGGQGIRVIDDADYRPKRAQVARAEAREGGLTPLLTHQWAQVQAISRALDEQLARFQDGPVPLSGAWREQSLIWHETAPAIWCRARPDVLHGGSQCPSLIEDLKTTSASAHPVRWTRSLFELGYDVQAAFYLRGCQALWGVEPEFRFVAVETEAPYAVSVIGLGPEALALGKAKVRRALDVWGASLASGRWPGYPTRTCWADVPPWEHARWQELLLTAGLEGPNV